MKKLAIIGASYLQKPLAVKAKELGIYTVCFAWADGAVCAEICDKFYDVSITEKERILSICQAEKIDGIVTIASDVAAPTVAFVAENMGLPGKNYQAAVLANNKYLMRNALVEAGIPCPKYIMINSNELEVGDKLSLISSLSYPLIIKPSDRSGSLGVTKVESSSELLLAIKKAIDMSFKKEAMIEEYIEGREISVEFISYNNKHYPLQITDKQTTGAPHFVELAHHQPSDLQPEQWKEVYELTEKALTGLGLSNGASHSEYKISDDGRIFVIEIGGRMGGDFIGSDLVSLSTGYDFVKGVIDVALGKFKEPVFTQHKYAGVYFLSKETANLLPTFRNWEHNPIFVAGEISDQELHELEKSSDRSGYVIYQSNYKLNL